MLTTLILLPFLLGVYWLLWKLYLWIAPKLFDKDASDIWLRPKYWQFALVLFVVSFVTNRNSNDNSR